MRATFFILLIFAAIHSRAQPGFQLKDDIPVSVDGAALQHPWAGGINFPIFSTVDLNSDGLQDLFLYDRSNNRAMTFVNTGLGGIDSYQYAPEFTRQLPALRGWAIFYDYNCDGKADLFTTGITNNGIMQFRNDSPPGSLQFTLVDSMMKADYGGGSISGIFASGFLMPHFNDIDGDGDMDVLGQQFFCVGTFAYYRNLSMDDYGVCDSLSHYVLDTYAWGNFALRSGAYPNVAVGQYNISCVQATTPEDMFGYELAVQDDTYAGIFTLDVDDDGDMEALIGDSGARNSLLVVNGGTSASANMNAQDTLFPSYDTPIQMNAFNTHAFLDADHDGVKDLVVGHNEFENKKGVLFYKNTGTNNLPVFDFVFNGFLQNEMIDVGEGAVPVFFDADSDGLKDLIIGNVNRTDSGSVVQHSLSYFRNTGTLTQPSFEFVTDDYAGISSYPISGPLFPTFGDLDGDGDMDLLLGHEVGELYYFENTAGVGLPANFVFTTPNYFNIDIGNSSAPQIIDLNRDGKQDLVIGKKSGIIAYFENIGSISIPFFSSVPTKDTLGGINVQTIGFVDGFSVPYIYEDSAEYKMLVACMRGDIYSYDGIEGNVLGNYIKQDTLISRYQGVKTTFNLSVSGGDINGDNQIDMLVGLYGGGLQIYLRDTLTSSISKVERTPLFNVFPNPANASFKIVADKMSIDRSSRLRIADVSGRILYDELFSGIEDVISTSEFSTGLYFVSLSNGVFVTTRRLTVLR